MGTYYSIGCERCREETSLARLSEGGSGPLGESKGHVPQFIAKHADHLDSLRVLNEHDERYGAYAEFEPAAQPAGALRAALNELTGALRQQEEFAKRRYTVSLEQRRAADRRVQQAWRRLDELADAKPAQPAAQAEPVRLSKTMATEIAGMLQEAQTIIETLPEQVATDLQVRYLLSDELHGGYLAMTDAITALAATLNPPTGAT